MSATSPHDGDVGEAEQALAGSRPHAVDGGALDHDAGARRRPGQGLRDLVGTVDLGDDARRHREVFEAPSSVPQRDRVGPVVQGREVLGSGRQEVGAVDVHQRLALAHEAARRDVLHLVDVAVET